MDALGTKELNDYEVLDSQKFPQQYYKLFGKISEDVIKLLKNYGMIIAGGAITSVFSGAVIKDFDLYPPNSTANAEFKKEFEQLIKNSNNPKDKKLFESGNAVTYRYQGKIYQLISKYVTSGCAVYSPEWTAEQILANFDFTVCMGAFNCKDSKWVLYSNFLPDVAARKLVFNVHSHYPICAMYRVLKYIKKGYEMSAGELVKIALSINLVEMNDYTDLKEQLMGIDTLVFQKLTDSLIVEHGEKAPVDFGMVMEAIDKSLNTLWEGDVDVEESTKDDPAGELPFN